ncbi:MotA/TolQ/ExbB proton channel family protein [Candidatus Mycalebacterium sp.]
MLEAFFALADDGGGVIYIIAFAVFAIWAMVVERAIFLFRFAGRKEAVAEKIIKKTDQMLPGRGSRAVSIRAGQVARLSVKIRRPMAFIRSLVAICPLLGLLGTVTGMMELFDSISFFGTGNSRAILSAVSHTTIPTMAGMLAGLFGAAADISLRHWAKINIDGVKRLIAAEQL